MELTLSAVPTTEPSSRIVIPVIAPAEAAFTQSTPPEPVDARTCPDAPDSLSLSKREPRSLRPPFTSKFVVGTVVPIPTL
jgi:hypothetical protein